MVLLFFLILYIKYVVCSIITICERELVSNMQSHGRLKKTSL